MRCDILVDAKVVEFPFGERVLSCAVLETDNVNEGAQSDQSPNVRGMLPGLLPPQLVPHSSVHQLGTLDRLLAHFHCG